ncbi:ABC transporter substrate-binding protein [Thermopolyspora sp. NPDC052614]|uniref:ABC transporter substrate-binding protein n=1 Tax=Thermopolyspora sp. NPDC052614 TaxID=3155682 RepID=UPI003448A088
MRLRVPVLTPVLAPVLAAVLALAVSACGSTAKEEATPAASGGVPLTVGLNYVGTVEHFAPYYALKEGLYAKEGLDVTIKPGGDTPPSTLLAAGQVDIAVLDTLSTITAASQGADFVAIATEYQQTPTSMTCRNDSGVKRPSDLAGKRLGLKQAANVYLPAILSAIGVTKDQIKIVPIGGQDVSLLISGQVDCMFSSFAFNEPRSIEAAGVPVTVFPLGQLGIPSQGNTYVTTRKIYDDPAKRAALTKWVGVMSKAYEVLLRDPEAGAKYMVDNKFTSGLDLDQQIYQSKTQTSYIADDHTAENGLLSLNPKAWEEVAKVAVKLKLTPKLVDVKPLLGDLSGEAGTAKL